MKSKQVNVLHVHPYIFYGDNYDGLEIHETTLFKPLMTYSPSDIDIISNSLEDIQVMQHFVLNPNLHLNITVHYMYFSSNSFLKCFFGSLNIESIVHSNDKTLNNTKYKYCGIVSSFLLYPASNKVTIAISLENNKVTFDTTISYSVIDSQIIISYEGKRTKAVAPITVMKLLSTGLYLLKYQLEVERYDRINIIFNISQYYFIKIFDGPGTLCNILKPFEGKGQMALYTTATFQSFVFLVTRQFEVGDTIFIVYNTTMSMKAKKEIYLQKNTSMFLTSEMELSNSEISMIKMDTEAQLFFKITIYQMKYTGIKYSSCGYAGITLYDINENGNFRKFPLYVTIMNQNINTRICTHRIQ